MCGVCYRFYEFAIRVMKGIFILANQVVMIDQTRKKSVKGLLATDHDLCLVIPELNMLLSHE